MCAPPTVFLPNFARNPFLVPYKGSYCSWFWISLLFFLPVIPGPLKPRYSNLSSKASVIFISLLHPTAHSAGRVSSTSIAESKIGTVCLSTAWSHERALTKALTCLAFYKVTIFPFSGDRLLPWSLVYFDTCMCLYAASSSLILLSRASIEMFLDNYNHAYLPRWFGESLLLLDFQIPSATWYPLPRYYGSIFSFLRIAFS